MYKICHIEVRSYWRLQAHDALTSLLLLFVCLAVELADKVFARLDRLLDVGIGHPSILLGS